VIGRLRSFGAFWYDFVVGDDWRVAVGVAGALGVTYAISRTSVPAWWVVPVAVPSLVALSLLRVARKANPASPPAQSPTG